MTSQERGMPPVRAGCGAGANEAEAPTNQRGFSSPERQNSLPERRLFLMTSQEGFEPPTVRLEGACSIRLSYWDIITETESKQKLCYHNCITFSTCFFEKGAGYAIIYK